MAAGCTWGEGAAPWHLQRRGLPAQDVLQRRGRCQSLAANGRTRSGWKTGALAPERGCGPGGGTRRVSRGGHRPRTARGGPAPSSVLFLFSKRRSVICSQALFLEPHTFQSSQRPPKRALVLPLPWTAVSGSLPLSHPTPPARGPRSPSPLPAAPIHPSCGPEPPALTASAWQILLPALN